MKWLAGLLLAGMVAGCSIYQTESTYLVIVDNNSEFMAEVLAEVDKTRHDSMDADVSPTLSIPLK